MVSSFTFLCGKWRLDFPGRKVKDNEVRPDLCYWMRTPEHTRSPARDCWSLLRPWIVRRVGVHGRANVSAGLGAEFVVPRFVAVDLAQPVRGSVLGQPL